MTSQARVLTTSFVAFLLAAGAAGDVTVTDRPHHLGDSEVREWKGMERPEGRKLVVKFQAHSGEASLKLVQRDVSDEWTVHLNGTVVGALERAKPDFAHYLAVPAAALRDGENELTVVAREVGDDIVVGPIELIETPLSETLHLGRVTVKVAGAGTGRPVPARVTVATPEGKLVPLYNAARASTAVRVGTMYTLGAGDALEVPQGDYVIRATRGMEWGLAEQRIHVEPGGDSTVDLSIAREVDTSGFVAADTHVHTYTYSGHGNATIQERMITLAGEGVELAIATDHNHHTDYAPVQEELGVNPFFHPVTGNEVTTENGHFNAFPMDPKGPLPDHKLKDWVKLVEDIRAKGAKVVILNHPHWPDRRRGPFGVHGLDPSSGDRASRTRYTFDCLELVNSTTDEKEPLTILADWMALLNRGERLTGIGSSDSHTVDDPVGQGRTYVRSSSDEPSEISVDEACEAFLRGDVSVSLGIFVDVEVNGQPMGRTVQVEAGKVEVALRIATPRWIHPRRALVFLNGIRAHEEDVQMPEEGAHEVCMRVSLEVGETDAHLICAVVGNGVTVPGWTTLNDYTLGVTNPIFLDADGDEKYTSPRDQARARLGALGTGAKEYEEALGAEDEVIALQMLSVLREERAFDVTGLSLESGALRRYVDWVRRGPRGHRH